MTITVQIGAVDLGDFLSARVFRSVETVSGEFSFDATAQVGNPYPVKVGDECKIFVNGIQQITGYVDELEVKYNSESHVLSITGRDKKIINVLPV